MQPSRPTAPPVRQERLPAPGQPRLQIVELFGLPGAGKTTLVNRLCLPSGTVSRKDLVAGRKALTFGQLARLAILTVTDWRWMGALMILAVRTPIWHPAGIGRLLRLAFFRTWMRSKGGLIVFDQGPLQSVWSIFFSQGKIRPPRRALTRVLRLLYADASVVLVEIAVHPETAATRITGREGGGSRLDGLPMGATRSALESLGELPAELLAAAQQAGLDVRTVSGEGEGDARRQYVQQLVDEAAAAPV